VSYVAYAPPWSVTDDDRRRRAKQYWPTALREGGSVKCVVCGLVLHVMIALLQIDG